MAAKNRNKKERRARNPPLVVFSMCANFLSLIEKKEAKSAIAYAVDIFSSSFGDCIFLSNNN